MLTQRQFLNMQVPTGTSQRFLKNSEASAQKKIENNIQKLKKKKNADTIPLRKICISYKANYMTRSLFIVLQINHPSISILLTSGSFYMIPEGFNPINPNQPRLLRVSCILLSVYSTQSPWNLQL